LSQLLGADSDKFIGKFNKATRERLKGLRNAVRAGEVGQASAARELLLSSVTPKRGWTPQFDQMKKLLLMSMNPLAVSFVEITKPRLCRYETIWRRK
jgi:hypothetical protein